MSSHIKHVQPGDIPCVQYHTRLTRIYPVSSHITHVLLGDIPCLQIAYMFYLEVCYNCQCVVGAPRQQSSFIAGIPVDCRCVVTLRSSCVGGATRGHYTWWTWGRLNWPHTLSTGKNDIFIPTIPQPKYWGCLRHGEVILYIKLTLFIKQPLITLFDCIQIIFTISTIPSFLFYATL